ncbi:unnamed protein product [Trifolium pratense]|uniref:Uncharacterized protein n=1 Tax=Trifolium pratense TaxID=57577 RepID=A0ACB0IIW0_TRIPR|nr:unnamed protein product [Trifolium pratense]
MTRKIYKRECQKTMLVNMQINDHSGGTYMDKVMGRKGGLVNEECCEEEEEVDMEDGDGEEMKVEERVIGDYECPEFIFSKKVEKRIYRPWRRSVIVKLLGKRIGYKALETRLNQMWVRKGVISIIDLSNGYYLVAFSNEEDQYAALMDGPWFIYDHYLTVKEWSPNFHPASDTIKEVAVWMRISGLPIEFYDSEILHYIGNRVGKTVKVDKNTLSQERGKYARLYVQVDLAKPLLAMFTVKNRKYNIEYEGLHMLCTTCGRFDHYKEECPNKLKDVVDENARKEKATAGGGNQDKSNGDVGDGPWRVDNNPDSNVEDLGAWEFVKESNMEGDDLRGINGKLNAGHSQKSKKKRENSGSGAKKGEVGLELSMKENNLATRGENVKAKTGPQGKKGVEIVVEEIGERHNFNLMGQNNKPNMSHNQNDERMTSIERSNMGPDYVANPGPKAITQPNSPRPPNNFVTPPSDPNKNSSHQNTGEMTREGEIFVDALDQGTNELSDSDMEVVFETPRIDQ